MKNLIVMASMFIGVTHSWAAPPVAKCEKKTKEAVLAKINKMPDYRDSAETRSIAGIKPLHAGGWLENFVVLVSDEVEPSEWLVVVETKNCKIKFLDITNDGLVSEIWD